MSIDPVTATGAAAIGPSDADLRQAALGFEELLVRRMAQSLTDASATDDTDGAADDAASGGDATTQLLQSFLPDALAQSVSNAGGLGLAASFTQALSNGGRS